MAVFEDLFERANGALGGNWVTINGTPSISGGSVVGAAAALAYNSSIQENGRHEVTIHAFLGTGQYYTTGAVVKSDGTSNVGFFCGMLDNTSTPAFGIRRGPGYGGTIIATTTLAAKPQSYVKYHFVWDNGHLTATLNDTTIVEVDDGAFPNAQYMGISMYGSNAPIADFRAVGGGALDFNVSPDIIGNFGLQWTLTAAGLGTSWTAGTPGTPSFTCDHGTIDSQTIADADSATLLYTPGMYIGPVVFTDPSTGETDTIMVTSDPTYLPEGIGCLLTDDGAALVNDTAAHTAGDLATSDMVVAAGLPGNFDLTLVNAIADLWYATFRSAVAPPSGWTNSNIALILWAILNGGIEHTSQSNLFDLAINNASAVGLLETELDELRTVTNYTLADVIAAIKGLDNRSLTQVYDLIAALPAADNQPVLDAIAAVRGATSPSIKTVVDLLNALVTGSGYDLGDVLTAINGIGSLDLTAVLNKLNAIQPSTASTLTSLATSVAGVATDLSELALVVDAIKAILDAWGVAGGPGGGAPVWPGLADVTLGTAVALSNGLVVTGPMHGVIVTITGHPTGAGRYVFGSVSSWMNVGAVIFYTDNNDYERAESIGLDSQVLTPRTMAVADGLIVRLAQGWTGTIQPWSKTA